MNDHIPSVFVAKEIACVQATQWGLDLGVLEVEIEGDRQCIFRHALGEANGVAHILANEGIRMEENSYLVQGVLEIGMDAVEKD
ncbi:hypothetical protein PVK06_047400 [Gossypium arboreum]|uniref:Uncharacterized protein n=1 Tax=Gossypium arboreum TaxID=29729 RepID=A0ABR0MF72_GOSAR|nr:hypothetical protein PVK06_047400 [Gossypium arboreum]